MPDSTKPDERVLVDAFMELLATTPWQAITMRAVAQRADVPLQVMLMTHASRLDLFAAFARQIDVAALAGDDPEMADEAVRERLFDVFMRRFDALVPYRGALAQIGRAAGRDPALAMALAGIASRSMARMAASADVDVEGPRGAVVLAGMLQVYARVMRVFVAEVDAGLPLTMAELDKALRQAERRISDLDQLVGPLCAMAERLRPNGEGASSAPPTAQAEPAGEGSASP